MARSALLLLLLCVAGCGDNSPPLVISDVTVLRPLPGMSMSAGYFTIENRDSDAIVISSVDSPQFAAIEMHETVTENDISRMQSIPELRVEPGERVRFEPGGKHLMLMWPDESFDTVTLNFYNGDVLLLTVRTAATDP